MTDEKKTYAAAEPEEVTMYLDTNGLAHKDRADAIHVNFFADLAERAQFLLEADAAIYENEGCQIAGIIMALARNDPDMLRIALGDRDAT